MSAHGYTESAGAGQARARTRSGRKTEGKGRPPRRSAGAARVAVIPKAPGKTPIIAGIVPGSQANPWGDDP